MHFAARYYNSQSLDSLPGEEAVAVPLLHWLLGHVLLFGYCENLQEQRRLQAGGFLYVERTANLETVNIYINYCIQLSPQNYSSGTIPRLDLQDRHS